MLVSLFGTDVSCMHADVPEGVSSSPSSEDVISFSEVDIITPGQKVLARKLTCDIVKGKSLLVTG